MNFLKHFICKNVRRFVTTNRPIRKALVEGEDYYFNDLGFMVFTEKYLLERGSCCKSKCKHCPYGFTSAENTKAQANKK
jgi:hypothetical protein